MLFPRAQSSIWHYDAMPQKRTRSLNFLRQKEQRRGKLTGTMRPSIDSLQHLQDYFQVLVPVTVACRRLLRSANCSACADDRSRPRVADPGVDLGAKKDYEGVPAKKLKAWHRRRHVGPQTERASTLSRAKTCAGWAPHCPGYIAMRSLPYGLISGLLRKRATANPFTRASSYSLNSNWYTSTTCWQKVSSAPHFLQPPAIDKEPKSNAKMYVNQRRDEMVVLGPVPEFELFAPLPWQHLFLSLDRVLLMNIIRIDLLSFQQHVQNTWTSAFEIPVWRNRVTMATGSVYTKWHCEIGAFLAPVGATSCLKCCFCFFIYCLAQPLLLLQVIFP